MPNEITRTSLAESLLSKTPPVVFEALPRKYYDDGHIPTARALPLEELEAIVTTVAADKAQAIVVYCANVVCPNSHEAAKRIAKLGYANVSVYVGGKKDWTDSGLRLEK